MRVKVSIIFLVTLFATMGIIYYSCENSITGETVYKGAIRGWVYDDSTKLCLQNVKVWAYEIPDTVYTDLVGMFHYSDIIMPRGEFGYTFIFQLAGYNDTTKRIYLKSDLETKIDSIFIQRNIF